MWEQGCSLKQDGGYESYLTRRSLAPFAYTMSCVAPAGCPSGGPRHSECRQYAPGACQIPAETGLWHQTVTRGRQDTEHRPQTVFAGTSAYKGAGEPPLCGQDVAIESGLRNSLWTGGYCRRTLMEHVPASRPDYLGGFVPRVEPMQPGGVSTRCNRLLYKSNPGNCFAAAGPLPPQAVYSTGRYSPGAQCSS